MIEISYLNYESTFELIYFGLVAEMLSDGLTQQFSTWWEGRAKLGELRCMQYT